MNNYARLHETKKDVAGVGASANATLDDVYLRAIEAESRAIEDICKRPFYTKTDTRYYDGDGECQIWLPPDSDLLSVTTLKVDDDGDGAYETTLTVNTDYWLYPDNSTPKYRIDLNPESATLTVFPRGRRRIQLVGKFGYSDLSEATGLTGTLADATDTSLVTSADASTLIYPGDTLLMGSEELYVSAVAGTTVTVTRGINGSTAAAKAAVAISVRRYPPAIEQAVRMRVVDQRWSNNSGMPMGEVGRGYNVEYARFMSLISPYRLVVV